MSVWVPAPATRVGGRGRPALAQRPPVRVLARGLVVIPALLVASATAVVADGPADTMVVLSAPRLRHSEMGGVGRATAEFRYVYGTRDPHATEGWRALAERLARIMSRDTTRVLADRDLTASQLTAGSVVLLGGPDANRWTARLEPALPVRFVPGGFEWHGSRYTDPDERLQLVLPDPAAPSTYLWLIVANTPPATDVRMPRPVMHGEDWRIERAGVVIRSGRFADTPRPWSYVPELDHDRERDIQSFQRSLVAAHSRDGRVFVASAPSQAAARAACVMGAERLLVRMRDLGLAPPGVRVRILVEPDLESKGLWEGSAHAEDVAADTTARIVIPTGHDVPDLVAAAMVVLERDGARPGSPFLEPAAAWCAGRLDGEPLATTVSRLYFGRRWPRADEAAAAPDHWRSPLVADAARAVLFGATVEIAGARAGARIPALLGAAAPAGLAGWCRLAGLDVARVARRYDALADSLAHFGLAAARAAAPRAWRPRDGFVRGVTLTPAPGVDHGYLSREAAEQLDRLKTAGANAVTLSTVAFANPDDPLELLPFASGPPDGATDEAVSEAAARAHARGLMVWLDPKLASVSSTQTPAGWNALFARYREFILHEASRAQRDRVEAFAVGDGFPTMAAIEPVRWQGLIADVRRIYDGTVTLVVDAEEAPQIGFWDAVDVIGIVPREPIVSAPTTDAAALRAGVDRTLAPLQELARRWHRPVWLLDAGYPVLVQPRGGTDTEIQRAADAALVAALEPATWVAGISWACWSSSAYDAGDDGEARSARGRPAEAVIVAALETWRGRPVLLPPERR